jgi:uncharacterized repeat protein (TIGR03803 family)
MSLTKFAQAALLLLAGLAAIPSAPAQTYKVLYSFTGGTDGALPFGGVTLDSTGNLYGTTKGDGAGTTQGSVFKLSPKGRLRKSLCRISTRLRQQLVWHHFPERLQVGSRGQSNCDSHFHLWNGRRSPLRGFDYGFGGESLRHCLSRRKSQRL